MITFQKRAWEDYLYWQQTDRQVLKRINELIKDTLRQPHEGIGKPEPLKHAMSGYWSRRITDEHRMVYTLLEGELVIVQLRYHYDR